MGKKQRQPKCVVTVRLSAIGDVAMTIPALYSACLDYPQSRFVMLTRPSMVTMFVNPPSNLTVVGIDTKGEYGGLTGMVKALKDIMAEYDADALIDLQDSGATRLMRLYGRLRGLRTSCIHTGHEGKKALTRKYDKIMLPLISSRQRYRDAFARAGFTLHESFDGFYSGSKGSPESYAPIHEPRNAGEHWVGIAPFANFPGKTYPTDLMHEVVKTLATVEGMKIFLFGSDGDREILKRWEGEMEGVMSLAGDHYGFGTELALVSNLDCMVSMASANMHLASLVSVPVVSIWGATHPYTGYKGWRQDDDNIIQLPLTCRPCSVYGDKPCHRGDYLCLNGIKPQVITDKVLSLLGLTRTDLGERNMQPNLNKTSSITL